MANVYFDGRTKDGHFDEKSITKQPYDDEKYLSFEIWYEGELLSITLTKDELM